MKSSTFLNYMAFVLFLTALVITGLLSFSWSFTETSFGGYLGFIIPLLMCLACFLAGVCAATASAIRSVPNTQAYRIHRSTSLTKASVGSALQATFTLVVFAAIGVMLAW